MLLYIYRTFIQTYIVSTHTYIHVYIHCTYLRHRQQWTRALQLYTDTIYNIGTVLYTYYMREECVRRSAAETDRCLTRGTNPRAYKLITWVSPVLVTYHRHIFFLFHVYPIIVYVITSYCVCTTRACVIVYSRVTHTHRHRHGTYCSVYNNVCVCIMLLYCIIVRTCTILYYTAAERLRRL